MKGLAAAVGVGAAAGAVGGLCFALGAGAASRGVALACRWLERWRTYQAASPDQRARMRVEDERLGDDRFDLWDTDRRAQ